jgi:glutamate dehydrogenase
MRERYAAELAEHPLRREIITNSVANSIVNRGGITFPFRAGEETGASVEQMARAFVVCREVFGLAHFVQQVEALDNVVSTNAQTSLYLEFRRLLDRAVRWFLTARPGRLDIGAEVERFGPVVEAMGPQVPELLRGDERKRLNRRAAEFEKAGVPEALARHTASLLDWYSLLDIVEIATDTGRDPQDVAALYYVVSERFGIDAMLGKVTRLPRDDRWDALARGALRDDLYSVLESLTRGVLDANPADGAASDPGEQYDVWARANQDSISRTKGALSGIVRLDNPNIAALSVALRTLRSVVRVGAATT